MKISYPNKFPGELLMLKLDFSLSTADERAQYIQTYMDPCAHYTAKELETISNYLIFGKDKDGKSPVDRKEIQIKTKYNSYARKEAESLDALMEKPTFDERCFQTSTTRYKTLKPTINRVADADVPGMKELWEVIDGIQYLIDVNKGKFEDESVKKLSSAELYQYQHYLIELRRQQFILRDSVKPVICRMKTSISPAYDDYDTSIVWDGEGSDFAIAPLGLYTAATELRFTNPRALEEIDYHWNENAKHVIDFREPLHIYELFEEYDGLETDAFLDVESTAAAIMKTLNFYRERAHLSEEQERLLDLKIHHVSNQKITEILSKEFGVSHSANYISTIYKQKICGKIAEAAVLHYDYYLNREIATAWKMCTCCGEFKLKDTREYMRRSRSSDGLSSVCKICDKIKRENKKNEVK